MADYDAFSRELIQAARSIVDPVKSEEGRKAIQLSEPPTSLLDYPEPSLPTKAAADNLYEYAKDYRDNGPPLAERAATGTVIIQDVIDAIRRLERCLQG